MKNRFKNSIVLIGIFLFLVSSCKEPRDQTDVIPVSELPNKVYVLNEGSFMNSNASVSMLDLTTGTMYNDLFNQTNNRPIGDVLQSMTKIGDNYYFVINNSNRIEITSTYPLTSVGVINGLSQPRYLVDGGNGKAYLSEFISYGDPNGRVSVIDLSSNTVIKSIVVGANPEKMLLVGDKLYVCVSGEDKIKIINTNTDVVESTITVAKGPNSIVRDLTGSIWVLCSGEIAYDGSWNVDPINSIPGALVKMNAISETVESTLTFSDNIGFPSRLVIDGSLTTLYYTYSNAVYKFSIADGTLATTPIINRDFYGLGVDPQSGFIYCGTNGFSANQKLIRYYNTGSPIDSFTVGVGPNGFVF